MEQYQQRQQRLHLPSQSPRSRLQSRLESRPQGGQQPRRNLHYRQARRPSHPSTRATRVRQDAVGVEDVEAVAAQEVATLATRQSSQPPVHKAGAQIQQQLRQKRLSRL